MNTPQDQPSAVQQGNTRERLLSAATSLFSQKGFAGASVRDICTAAEANIAAINYYFGSKEALYAEVVQSVCEGCDPGQVMPCLAENPSDPEGRLAAWIEWFVRTNLNPRMEQMAQLMRRELAQPTAMLDQIIIGSVKPPVAALHELVQALLPEKAPPNELGFICASITAPILVDMLCETLSRGLEQGSMGDIDGFANFCVRWAMVGLKSSGAQVSDNWLASA